ncbi:MAG: hypothetical protein ACE5GX_15095 [Thermoanaerobaculia bacterium]
MTTLSFASIRTWIVTLCVVTLALPAGVLAGTIVGKTTLEGDYQIAGRETMDADALIKAKRSVVVSDRGGLANVVVSVENVKGSHVAPSEPAELNQKEKTFVPHVLPVVKGQPVEFVNSDLILHNIHAFDGETTIFNTAMPFQGQRMPVNLESDDDVVKVTCDVHKNMQGWVLLRDNPFFGVSKETGLFSIEDVPAGTYSLRAWHEVFGTIEQTITVRDGEEKTPVIFKFEAG